MSVRVGGLGGVVTWWEADFRGVGARRVGFGEVMCC